VGGLVTLALLVLPAARRVLGDNPALDSLLERLRRRFLPLTHFSLVMLVATGMIQTAGDENYDGMLQFDNDWSRAILLKHVAVGGMFLCGLALQFGVLPALERARLLRDKGKAEAQQLAAVELKRLARREQRLTWINLILGALTLAFTAWATAI
jgi:uncharacterized membrane protein